MLVCSFFIWGSFLVFNKLTIGRFYILLESLMKMQGILSNQLDYQNEFKQYLNTQSKFLEYLHKNKSKKEVLSDEAFRKLYNEITKQGKLSIVCKNVSFKYPNESHFALKNFTYEFEPFKTYVIVGRNGAGKTTLFKLLIGIYEPSEGNLFINGMDVKTLSVKQRSELFTVLFQNPNKYPLSLAENIKIGAIENEWDVKKWKETFYDQTLPQYIESLPNRWESRIGTIEKKTTGLSGGQWQKLFMGRVTFSKAPIMILDEPTASMDPLSEFNLYKAFEENLNRNINMIISHRLGVVKFSDKILVLKEGELIQEGKHEKLLGMEGEYRELYEAQKEMYKK